MESQRESCPQPRNERRVILFPLPFQGHINPMLQVGSILYSQGFSITVIHTKFNSLSSSNYPHFEFHSFDDGLSESEVSTVEDLPALILAINAKCVLPFRDCLSKLLMSNAQGLPDSSFACLISDVCWHFPISVAEDFKLPAMVLQTNSITGFFVYAARPFLLEKGYLPVGDSESDVPVTEFPPLRVKDIPTFETKNSQNIEKVIAAMVSETKASSSGMIWNSIEELEEASLAAFHKQYSPIPVFPMGPFHKYFPASSSSLQSQDQNIISWLDKQAPRSVIYVSFGSVAAINKTQFLEIAWGLANSQVPFLWVVRPGLVVGAEWLEPLPKGFLEMVDGRGCIVKWAPQQQVLSHPGVGGFWTHSGWNSTLESICEGVPMICQPCLGDQMLNARHVSHVWRVGLNMEGKLERREIESAIRRLMIEAEGQEMRERIMQMKEKGDFSLREGGSSNQALQKLVAHILSL